MTSNFFHFHMNIGKNAMFDFQIYNSEQMSLVYLKKKILNMITYFNQIFLYSLIV